MIYTVYTTTTGVIRHVIDSPDLATVMLNVETGEAVVEGFNEATQVYMTWEGPQPYPEKPGDWAVWDGAQWADPRSPADLEAELQAKRDAAWLTKPDFLLACMASGILTPAEAAAAAQGIVPEPFQSAVDALDPTTQAYLAVIWPTATRIERMDTFIEAIAAMRGLSDALVDQLFGIEVP